MGNFVGKIGGHVALYAVIKKTGRAGAEYIYTITDDKKNVLVLETEEEIDYADGGHYFLIEAAVKEHRTAGRVKQTVLADCEWELIGSEEKTYGCFFGKIGSTVELNDVTAAIRRTARGTEWLVNGEYSVAAPVSEYRLIIEQGSYTFAVPYDSVKKLKLNAKGKFNVKAMVIGYTVEKEIRTTFLYPIRVEDKNGPFHGGGIRGFFGGIFVRR